MDKSYFVVKFEGLSFSRMYTHTHTYTFVIMFNITPLDIDSFGV